MGVGTGTGEAGMETDMTGGRPNCGVGGRGRRGPVVWPWSDGGGAKFCGNTSRS